MSSCCECKTNTSREDIKIALLSDNGSTYSFALFCSDNCASIFYEKSICRLCHRTTNLQEVKTTAGLIKLCTSTQNNPTCYDRRSVCWDVIE